MGTWGSAPWDNDYAADWFGELVGDSGLRDRVVQTLQMDRDETDDEVIRAAATVLLMLGHVYVWPIHTLEEDLALAVARLDEILADEGEDGDGVFASDSMQTEVAVLRTRLERLQAAREGRFDPASEPEPLEWWKF